MKKLDINQFKKCNEGIEELNALISASDAVDATYSAALVSASDAVDATYSAALVSASDAVYATYDAALVSVARE